jgi:hypothetical protein
VPLKKQSIRIRETRARAALSGARAREGWPGWRVSGRVSGRLRGQARAFQNGDTTGGAPDASTKIPEEEPFVMTKRSGAETAREGLDGETGPLFNEHVGYVTTLTGDKEP